MTDLSSHREHQDERPTIEVSGLTKRFGDFVAVDNVTFHVEKGEVYGWLGPNGAGKTTTIRMLLGLLRPSSGEASVLGINPATAAKKMQARVGYMSQAFTLYRDLTAAENIRFYGLAYGLRGRELQRRRAEIIEMAGLRGREHELTSNLSGGWKQRLALGCAIAHRPEVVFLDEPTAGVDPINRRRFWDLIYELADHGMTVLVTTHYMDEAELCQRVGFLNRGRLIALDTPHRLKETRMRGQVLEISVAQPERALQALVRAQQTGRFPARELALYGSRIHAVVPDADEFGKRVAELLLANNLAVQRVEWIEPTLEDVFISAVQEDSQSQSASVPTP